MIGERWRIELFGGLRLSQGDRVVTRFRTQKTACLFAYLAFHVQRKHRREALIEMLWPDSEPEAGQRSLRVALTSLRHQLEPPGTRAGDVLLADRATVGLNPAAVTTDAADFEAALRAAAAARSAADRARHLREAVGVYRGELLPECFEEWVLPEQQRLADSYVNAVLQITAYLRESGDLHAALDCARRALSVDPLREEIHHRLMSLLVASGEPAAALRQYRQLERLLQEQLDVAPSPTLRKLASEIEAQEAGCPGDAGSDVPPPPVVESRAAPAPEALPTGVVAFLVIEAGAPASADGPGRGAAALAARHAQLRERFGAYGGREVRARLEGSVVAFRSPSEAAACAVASQQSLAAQPWEGSLPVRMAVHAGEVELVGGEYQGSAIAVAFRLLAAAHAGQVLCSEAAATLIGPRRRSSLALLDLGRYRLGDASPPERLFQVQPADLPRQAFPPPAAPTECRANVPLPLTRFFGREEELARIERLLLDEARRLVTLTGPAGTGKTRLAVEAAARLVLAFAGAVWFVPLASLTLADDLPRAVADAMRVSPARDVDPIEQVARILERQRSLLVLDNLEHLVGQGAGMVHALVRRVASLRILVTSRRHLGLPGERVARTPPLPIPSESLDPHEVAACDSVRLFVDRAQTVRPDFQVTPHNAAAVAELCRHLEGIPLAIELVAARAAVFAPAQALGRLGERLDWETRGGLSGDSRHRTLRAALDWSLRLLSSELQQLLARLSVFRGGWTVAAVQAVCGSGDATVEWLSRLQAHSLIQPSDELGDARFGMLVTVREYAWEQIAAGERDRLQRCHAEWYLGLAEATDSELHGSEQERWLRRLDADQGNLRAALEWGATAAPDLLVRLAAALGEYWEIRGRFGEGRQWLGRALSAPDTSVNAWRARALRGAGRLAWYQGDFGAAAPLLEESLACYRRLGDPRGTAAVLSDLGDLAYRKGDSPAACSLQRESVNVSRGLRDTAAIGRSLVRLGQALFSSGEFAAAGPALKEGLTLCRDVGDQSGTASALYLLGTLASRQGEYAQAHSYLTEGIALGREVGDLYGVGFAIWSLGTAMRLQGDYEAARALYTEAMGGVRQTGSPWAGAFVTEGFAYLAVAEGQHERAALLLGAAEALREQSGSPLPASNREDYDRAVAALRACLDERTLAACWDEGRAMTLERVVAYALGEVCKWVAAKRQS